MEQSWQEWLGLSQKEQEVGESIFTVDKNKIEGGTFAKWE
jgi:hypothetical protein